MAQATHGAYSKSFSLAPEGNVTDGTDSAAAPNWNLDDLYKSTDDKALKRDLERVAAEASHFNEAYAGKVASLDGNGLADAIEEYERVDERMGRLVSYAQLLHAGDQLDAKIGQFFQTINEKLNDASALQIFFTLEINGLDDDALQQRLQSSERLRAWNPWLTKIRTFRDHQLSDEAERLLHDKQVAGRGAWNRLFDETIAGLRFPLDGKDVTEAEALHQLSSPDRARREAAARTLADVFGKNIKLCVDLFQRNINPLEVEILGVRHSARAGFTYDF